MSDELNINQVSMPEVKSPEIDVEKIAKEASQEAAESIFEEQMTTANTYVGEDVSFEEFSDALNDAFNEEPESVDTNFYSKITKEEFKKYEEIKNTEEVNKENVNKEVIISVDGNEIVLHNTGDGIWEYNGQTWHTVMPADDMELFQRTFLSQNEDAFKITGFDDGRGGGIGNTENGIRMYNQSNATYNSNGNVVKIGDMSKQCRNLAWSYSAMITGKSSLDLNFPEILFPQIDKQATADGLMFYELPKIPKEKDAVAEVCAQIDSGNPPVLCVKLKGGKLHWVVAAGYKEGATKKEDILIIDTEDGKIKPLTQNWDTHTMELSQDPITIAGLQALGENDEARAKRKWIKSTEYFLTTNKNYKSRWKSYKEDIDSFYKFNPNLPRYNIT